VNKFTQKSTFIRFERLRAKIKAKEEGNKVEKAKGRKQANTPTLNTHEEVYEL